MKFTQLRQLNLLITTLSNTFGIDGYLLRCYNLRKFTLIKPICEKFHCYESGIPSDYEFSIEEESQVKELYRLIRENYQFPKL